MSRLFSMERRIVAYLARLVVETRQPTVNVSAAQIATAIGSGSRRHVITCLDRLEAAGEIQRSAFVPPRPGVATPPRSITLLKAAWLALDEPDGGDGPKPTAIAPTAPSLSGGFHSEKGDPANTTRSEGQADICYVKDDAATIAASSIYRHDHNGNSVQTLRILEGGALNRALPAEHSAPPRAEQRTPPRAEQRAPRALNSAPPPSLALHRNTHAGADVRGRASGSALHSQREEKAEQSGAEDRPARPCVSTADWLGVEDRRWIAKLIDQDALVWVCREAADLGLTPDQLSRTIEVLRKRFADAKRRQWSNARKMGFIRKGLRCGYGWKADTFERQERESNERHSIEIAAKREQIQTMRVQVQRDEIAQRDYDDAIAAADDMEQRARRMHARGAGTDVQLAEVIVRCQAIRSAAEIKLRSSRGAVGGDDPPAPARVHGETTHTPAIEVGAFQLRIAQ